MMKKTNTMEKTMHFIHGKKQQRDERKGNKPVFYRSILSQAGKNPHSGSGSVKIC
jgi:hypothetical protein